MRIYFDVTLWKDVGNDLDRVQEVYDQLSKFAGTTGNKIMAFRARPESGYVSQPEQQQQAEEE